MLRITALNQTSKEDKFEDELKKKDETEKIALNEYSSAVKLLVDNKKEEALEILEELLKTQLLYELKPSSDDGNDDGQKLKSLKYSCLKNISSIQNSLENYDNAFDNNLEALNLDDTDVKLWCKVGELATKLSRIDLACLAYKQGLKRNNYHWPCLDGLISALFSIPDYLNCLLYISIALERDPSYVKGLILQKKIIETIPSIENCDQIFDKWKVNFRPNRLTENVPIENCNYTETLKNNYIEKLKEESVKKPLEPISYDQVINAYSWSDLGTNLVQIYKYFADNQLNFINPVELIVSESLKSCKKNAVINVTKSTESVLQNGDQSNQSDNSENKIQELQNDLDKDVLNSDKQLSNASNNEPNKFESNNDLDSDKNQKVKKRRRSSLSFLTDWAWSDENKKRSSRNRNTGRKDHSKNYIMLEENLKQLFPSTLLNATEETTKDDNEKNDSTVIKTDSNSFNPSETDQTTDSDGNVKDSEYFESECELVDVENFIEKHSRKNNLIIIMTDFLSFLSEKWNIKWPTHLIELYIQIYLYMKNHTVNSSQIFDITNRSTLNTETKITLFFCEVYLDKFINVEPTTIQRKIDISPEDLGFLAFYSISNELSELENENYVLRIFWFKANLYLHQGETELSIKILEEMCEQIKQFNNLEVSIKLINCQFNSTINEKTVKEMLRFIKRKEKLSNIKHLYELKEYEKLCSILEEVFNSPSRMCKLAIFNESPSDRVDHMIMLLNSLSQIKQLEECFTCAELCLNESWQNYMNLLGFNENEEDKKKWIQAILYSLEKIHDSLSEIGTFIVKFLPEYRRLRLLQNLTQIVCHQLDMLDNGHSIIIESISPWIIFHHIFLYEEDKQRANSVSVIKCKAYNSTQSESDEDEEDVPGSIKVLVKAHEFLGHYGLCCMNSGKLLKFIMNLVVPKLHFPLFFSLKQKFKMFLEQAIFCLYGYHTKSKSKYIDHVKTHMSLTWEASQLLFEIYKPSNVPNFDSKKSESINTDTFSLFKRIVELIPTESDPSQLANEMNLYLIGNLKKMPCVKKPFPFKVSYIFYLIADYYFKGVANQSFENAIKYYTYDLCLHHDEFNSWVGLAMSTSTLMETWINNFQPDITEEKYFQKAEIAQKSYEKAIELDQTYLTIWTEFGNFLYTVHSFCSRVLKQESDSLSMEKFGKLESKKDDMLVRAKNCFESAFNIYTSNYDDEPDERWLYQYMLAKIAEKKKDDPPIFLKHYLKAGKLLYQNNAVYPKKINHKNPPNLSIEALEVHYRIHTSILKYLEQNEGKPLKKSMVLELENILERCLRSPFIVRELKSDNALDVQKNNKESGTAIGNNVPVMSSNQGDSQVYNSLKRPTDESSIPEDTKKIKYSNIDLIKDVVNLTDDLIAKVCNEVNSSEQMGFTGESKSETAHGSTNVSVKSGSKKSGKDNSDSTSVSSTENSSGTDDSSDSASCRSDSTVIENNGEEKIKNLNQEVKCTEEDKNKLIEYCIAALEECVLRFPEHYKSIYRLAYFFFHSKNFKNVSKSQQLLLGSYQCQFHKNHTIQGLFTERKSTNFFNGIWRIPITEIDRPGSFPYHMSRCVMLLMDILNESGDSKMLTELCVQLRKTPDSDKKYLKDIEREQLSNQALTLCLQCLRNKINKLDNHNSINSIDYNKTDKLISVILEIYHTYQNIKNMQEFETSHLPKLKKLLESAYVLCSGIQTTSVNIFDLAKDFCRNKLRAIKLAETTGTDLGIQDMRSNVSETKAANIVLNPMVNVKKSKSQNSSVNKKSQDKIHGTKKLPPPPPVNNYNPLTDPLLTNSLASNLLLNSGNPLITPNASQLMDLVIKSSLQQSMLNAPLNYASFQNILNMSLTLQHQQQQYQQNLLAQQNNEAKLKNSEVLNLRNPAESSSVKNIPNVTKERPDISITPVSQNAYKKKQKAQDKFSTNKNQNQLMNMPMPVSSSVQISPTPPYSLLKTSQTSQPKPPTLTQDQIYSSNNLLITQKNPPINHPPITQRNQSLDILASSFSWPVATQPEMSKKRLSDSNSPLDGSEKKKKKTSSFSDNHGHYMYPKPTNYRPPTDSTGFLKLKDINTLKEKPSSSKPTKQHAAQKKSKPYPQPTPTDNINNSFLSQLQHHPHLEIIPQTTQTKPQKNLGKDVEVFVTPKLVDPLSTDNRFHGMSQSKPNSIPTNLSQSKPNPMPSNLSQSKPNPMPSNLSQTSGEQKSRKDSVEIITLDD